MTEPRGIVFDLDDTLYPRRAFLRSGFAAVADDLGARTGRSPRAIYRSLSAANRTHAGRELQLVCERLGLPADEVARQVRRIRRHIPSIVLPAAAAEALGRLRRGWRIGILTNGVPAIQRRKVEALGVAGLVDAVVYAANHGSGRGKPERAAFTAVLRRLGTRASRTVFVGDDPVADLAGARGAGLHPVDIRQTTLRAVPRLAARLVTETNS